jgi:hypothetical protein
MLPKRDLSHINNLNELRVAKLAAIREIEEAEINLEETFSKLPLRALGGAVGFAAGLMSKGIKENKRQDYSQSNESDEEPGSTLKSGLQALGIELAMMGLTKLISKLMSKKR